MTSKALPFVSRHPSSFVFLFTLLLVAPTLPAAAETKNTTPPATDKARRAEAAFEFARAKLLADAGDFDAALAAYRRAIELDPGDPYSLVELARFQSYLAQFSRSTEQQRQLLDDAAQSAGLAKAAAPDNADVLETYGQVHMRLGELDPNSASLALAQGAFEILRRKEPQELPVLLSLGQLYLWQQDAVKAVEVLEAAAKTSPGHRMVLSMLVEAQLAAGENDGAIDSLRQLLRVEPANPEHRIRLAELLAGREEHAAAVQVLEEAPPEMAPSQRVKQILAREYHLSGRNTEALALVEELALKYPGNEGLRRLRAAVLAGLIRYREALADMEPLVKKEVDPERRAQDTLLVARLKERIGDGVGAAAMLESSRADFRGQTKTELTVALAGILERSGRSAEAETLLRAELEGAQGEELVQLGGALAEVLNGLGRREEAVTLFSQLITKVGTGKAAEPLYWRQTLMAAAHKNWQQVLELLPRLEKTERPELAAAVEQLRATAEAGLGEIDRALAGLAAAKALSPLQVRAKRWEILQEAGRSGEFESELAALAASAKPEDQRFAAQMLQRFERYAEVVPVLEKLVAGEPEAQELQFGLAVAYERAGNHQKAVTLFEQLLAKDPNHAASLNYLGYMWAERRENLDQALAYILRAVALEPDNGAYVDSLGWAYFQVGRYQEAREQLEWAVRLVDDDATLHQHLGAVYGKLGQLDKAKEAYAQALELEKKAERQAEIQKELDALLRGAVPK